MCGSHTGSDLRLLSRSLCEPRLGVMVPVHLPVSEGVPVPVEVRLQIPWGADLSGADDKSQPSVVQGRQVGGREHAGARRQ